MKAGQGETVGSRAWKEVVGKGDRAARGQLNFVTAADRDREQGEHDDGEQEGEDDGIALPEEHFQFERDPRPRHADKGVALWGASWCGRGHRSVASFVPTRSPSGELVVSSPRMRRR